MENIFVTAYMTWCSSTFLNQSWPTALRDILKYQDRSSSPWSLRGNLLQRDLLKKSGAREEKRFVVVYLLTLAQSLTYFFHYELWNGKPVSTDSLRIEWQLQGSTDKGINDWESTETIFVKKMLQAGGRWEVKGKDWVAFTLNRRELINRESTEVTYKALKTTGRSSTF